MRSNAFRTHFSRKWTKKPNVFSHWNFHLSTKMIETCNLFVRHQVFLLVRPILLRFYRFYSVLNLFFPFSSSCLSISFPLLNNIGLRIFYWIFRPMGIHCTAYSTIPSILVLFFLTLRVRECVCVPKILIIEFCLADIELVIELQRWNAFYCFESRLGDTKHQTHAYKEKKRK